MPTEREYNYSNLNDYLRFVRENFKPTKTIRVGLFVSQNYLFHLNPLYKKYPQKKKYLDFFPIDLVIYDNPKKKYFAALNWHALPVPTRQILKARLEKQFQSAFNENKPMIRIPGINYKKLLRFLRKVGVGIRRYRYERVRKLAIIPPNMIDEVLKFKALTWYGSNYQGIKSQYDKYRPKAV